MYRAKEILRSFCGWRNWQVYDARIGQRGLQREWHQSDFERQIKNTVHDGTRGRLLRVLDRPVPRLSARWQLGTLSEQWRQRPTRNEGLFRQRRQEEPARQIASFADQAGTHAGLRAINDVDPRPSGRGDESG